MLREPPFSGGGKEVAQPMGLVIGGGTLSKGGGGVGGVELQRGEGNECRLKREL